MTPHRSTHVVRLAGGLVAALSALVLTACGNGSDNGTATPTPTPTLTAHTPTRTATPVPTATRTPQPGAAVRGVLVVSDEVGTGQRDGLNPLPPEATQPGFDRALGSADWTVDGETIQGVTGPDGSFEITGLSPGRHLMRVTKTVAGNLLEFVVPIVVGDDGGARVVAEVSWGLVRATSVYTQGGAAMQAVFAPNGSHAITRAGQVVEIGDYGRTLVDADGDGRFDPQGCSPEELYLCGPDRACGDGRYCGCASSCPDCEDCVENICLPPTFTDPTFCVDDRICKSTPYECGEGGTCAVPGDQCVCVSACFGCDGCGAFVCVPAVNCVPVEIDTITVYGPARLVVGQESGATAVASLSDGSAIDVTWLATWASSDSEVAEVDAWGRLTAADVGTTDITATLGEVVSAPLRLEVVERPTLLRIYLQNVSCWYPLGIERDGHPTRPPEPVPPTADGFLPPPICSQVVRIGATIQFSAVGEFDTGYYEDITDEVSWRLVGDAIGDVDLGLFTARQAGAARLQAVLGTVESDALEIKVVTEPTIVALSVYPGNYAYPFLDGGPVRPGADAPCFECGYSLTLLRGDTLQFFATAHYDTGEWEDVTARVAWRSSDTEVATIDASGLMTAAGAGDATIDATLGDVTSAPLALRVVNEATLTALYIYQEGQDRAIGKGEQAFFHAVASYDIGISRDVTAEATWRSSNETAGGFDTPGVFTGRGAGTANVSAELAGQQSELVPIEVYETSEIAYCDPDNVNRGVWSDDFNRVVLESDCAAYTLPDVVELRFTVTEQQRPGGIFDPCLDLFAYRDATLVRTIREEGCGDPFLAPTAPGRDEAVVRYQTRAFWDLKDEQGQTVPPGAYTIHGRFYLYYDPVVSIDFTVNEPSPGS